jgi:hypothetical protein
MFPAKSEFTAELLLSVLNNEPELQLYFGILSSIIKKVVIKGEDDKIVKKEITDAYYARQPISFTKPKDNYVKITEDIRFPRTSQKWERVTHFGIYDAAKGGNMLLLKQVGSALNVDAGDVVTIHANEFILYVGHGSFS